MAGTPTTNYNIPTYADTDAPDLSGAYNDAMGIIDTQLKANADAIESATTGNYTGTAPITVDNEGRTIGINTVTLDGTGEQTAPGIAAVTGMASAISTTTPLNTPVVPNSRAVADYVATHGGTAYTAGNGIEISGDRISTKNAIDVSSTGGTDRIVEGGAVDPSWCGTVAGLVTRGSDIDKLIALNDAQHRWPGGLVPTLTTLKQYVESKMAAAGAAYTGTAPIAVDNGSHTISVADSTTSAKGVVQLTSTPYGTDSDTLAVTPNGLTVWMTKMRENAGTPVTVDMLSKLYIGENGVVFYKPDAK